GRRQAFGGELHADLRDLIGGNEDRAPVAALLIGDVQRVELCNDRARLAAFETGIENGFRCFRNHAEDVEKKRGQYRGDAGHSADAYRTHAFENVRQDPLRLFATSRAAESPLRFGLVAKLGKPCREYGKIRLNLLGNFCRSRSAGRNRRLTNSYRALPSDLALQPKMREPALPPAPVPSPRLSLVRT